MEHTLFIGTGRNPDGSDLPLGLGSEISRDPKAIETFRGMTSQQKRAMIHYIRGAESGAEARGRILDVVRRLGGGQQIW